MPCGNLTSLFLVSRIVMMVRRRGSRNISNGADLVHLDGDIESHNPDERNCTHWSKVIVFGGTTAVLPVSLGLIVILTIKGANDTELEKQRTAGVVPF